MPNPGDAHEQERERFREAMALFETGVAVVTANPREPVGMTASGACSLALDPLELLVCVSTRLPGHAALEESDRFVVNVLGEGQQALAERFATAGLETIEDAAFEDCRGLPLLRETLAHFVCARRETISGREHSVCLGRVTALGLRREARPLWRFGGGIAGATADGPSAAARGRMV